MGDKQNLWYNNGDLQSQSSASDQTGPAVTHFGYQTVPEAEKSEYVLRHFNSVADQYDFMNTLLSFGIHYWWKRTAVRLIGLMPGQHVLDVCGGTGDLSVLALKKMGPSGQATLYDINRAMIEAGRRKTTHASLRRRIRYVQGDAEALCFDDDRFDAAMVGFGIRNVTHIERGFAEMFRVLKPGGKLMCLEFSKPSPAFFRGLYDFYSFHIMPLLGQWIVGSRKAYTHLPESIRLFPLPGKLSTMLANIGFKQVVYHRLTQGIAVIHLARKPD